MGFLSNLFGGAKDKAAQAADAAGNVAEAAVDTAKDVASDTAEMAGDAAEAVVGAAETVADEVTDMVDGDPATKLGEDTPTA